MIPEDAVKGRLLEFVTKDNLILNGFLTGPEESRICLVYVHGMTGNFYRKQLPFTISKILKKEKVSVFSMNTRGHDAIAVNRKTDGGHLVAGTDLERFEDSVLDIEAAIAKLSHLGFRSFLLVGHSTGCQKVTFYQYKKQDKRVIGIILLAPVDDYAVQKRESGKKFAEVVKRCKNAIKNGKGNESTKDIPSHFSPKRFLSVSDLNNIEARLFDYSGPLKEFSSIKTPIAAVFGSKEEYSTMPISDYMIILKNKTKSSEFVGAVFDGATHSFNGYEDLTAEFTLRWLQGLGSSKVPTKKIIEVNGKFPLAALGYR